VTCSYLSQQLVYWA